jgi:TonB family protein
MPTARFAQALPRIAARILALSLFASLLTNAASAQSSVATPGSATAPARATAASLDSAARQVLKALAKTKAPKLAVFDFINAGSLQWDRMGQKLAADFRSQFAALPGALPLEDRDKLVEMMRAHSFTPYDVTFPTAADTMLHDSGTNAWAVALISPNGATIDAEFSVYAIKKPGKPPAEIATFSSQIPFTPELKAMIDAAPPDPLDAYPVAGKDGVGMPKVIMSHPPDATAAIRARFHGTVYLVAVIEANGDVGTIRAIRGAPYGLSDAAVNCVRNWKFEPARDKDGKPVAVRQTIEIQFSLY